MDAKIRIPNPFLEQSLFSFSLSWFRLSDIDPLSLGDCSDGVRLLINASQNATGMLVLANGFLVVGSFHCRIDSCASVDPLYSVHRYLSI